jgi:SAM-dependent methyltransferase
MNTSPNRDAASPPICRFPPDAFSRDDDSDDCLFYAQDRFVSHLDSQALSTVEKLIEALVIETRPVILDLMASWDSHLSGTLDASRVVGLGLNRNELEKNPRLSESVVHDLNADPVLPFSDGSFDVVINTVSVDYLTRPFEVFGEVVRTLKPGGLFLVIFSNRLFPEKAVKMWREATESERVDMVRAYFESTVLFEPVKAFSAIGRPRAETDKYAHLGVPSDPIYAVYAEKKGGEPAREPRPELPPDLGVPQPDMRKDQEENTVCSGVACPHCGQRLKKWAVPCNPLADCGWDNEFMFICFNDWCPYFMNGWKTMAKQGRPGMSYRYMFDAERKTCVPIPVTGLQDLRYGIVEEEEDEPQSSKEPE